MNNTMKRLVSITLAVIISTFCIPIIGVSVYADAPTKIYTAADLYAINSNMSGNYILMNDIDLSSATDTGGEWDFMGNGWEPIGSYGSYGSTAFTGTFDGNGYTIKGLRLDISTIPSGNTDNVIYAGLFGNNSGTIKNLSIDSNSSIHATATSINAYVGSFAGYNTGVISNCYNEGELNLDGENKNDPTRPYATTEYNAYLGGICGYSNGGEIINCANEGMIYGSSYGSTKYTDGNMSNYHAKMRVRLGGIAGFSSGSIANSYNTGDITGSNSYKSYSTYTGYDNSAVAIMYAGGITGEISGLSIENSYSSGSCDVKPYSSKAVYYEVYTGGLIGQASSGSNAVSKSYCFGNINEGEGASLAGNGIGRVVATNCYYVGNFAKSQSGMSALSIGQMSVPSCFIGFDFDGIWLMDPDSEYKAPQITGNRQDNKSIELVDLITEPAKKDYYTDELPDPDGGTVKIYYKNGTRETKNVKFNMLRGYDMSVVGEQEVTVNYRDFTSSYMINVAERPEIDTMTLISEPNKKEFVKGTAFDFSGCQVRICYKNGTEETIDVTARMTEGGDINRLGTQTITYSLLNKSVDFTVKVIPVEIESIVVSSMPNQTIFVEGKPISIEGLEIKAIYNNGDEQSVTDYTLSELPTSIGKYSIEVSYSGCTTSFEIEIVKKSAVSIRVKADPEKTTYVIGQVFDPTGMVVEATFDNDDVLEVSDYTIGTLPDKVGSGRVEIEYQGQKAYVSVTMKAKVLESISVSQLPDKVNYIQDEDFEDAGLKVSANWNNGISEEVSDYSLSNTGTSKVGTKTVIVLYEGLTTSFEITIVEKSVVSLAVTPPSKTSYIRGEEFDASGMTVTATYDNGKSETVKDYELSGFGDSDEDANLVTVSYKGLNRSFLVTIHTPEDDWIITTLPNCTEGGVKELHCADCGKLLKTEEIDALDHDWSEWATVDAPNCTDKGSQKRVCSRCNIEEFMDVDPNGHTWVETYVTDLSPTCTSEGSESWHCSECGVSDPAHTRAIDKLPHNLGEWTTTKEPTCAVEGVKQRKCADCGYLETDEISATGNHSFDDWTTIKEPTCTEKGSKDRECSVCHLVETADIAATGKHKYGDWTTVKEPTCTEKGSKERICSMCGDKETESIDAKGHKWNIEYTVDKAATETAAGSKSIHCLVCNAIKPGSSVPIDKMPPAKLAEGAVVSVPEGKVTVTSAASGTVAFSEAPNQASVTIPDTVVVNGKIYTVTEINAKAFAGKKIRTVTIGKNVKKIKKNTFKGTSVTKLIVKTKKLTKKSSVKGSLKGSKVKTVQVKVGKKSLNKKYVKKYKKVFTKKNAGKKVKVK